MRCRLLTLLLAAAACASPTAAGPDAGQATSGTGGATQTAGAGGSGGTLSTGGGGGARTTTGSGGAVGSGGAGQTGGGGAGQAGSGGGAGQTGSGGAAQTGSGGAIVRGGDPTEQTASMRGPYQVMRYSSGVADSPAYGAYDVDYPTDATPPLAGVAVIPGFIEGRSAVGDWGPFLASHGFAVITIDPNSSLDTPPTRADALWAAVGSLKAENARAGSPLAGKIDLGRFAVMGHSMGGGGTLEAANAHSADLRAAVPLAPWDTTTSFPMITVPTLILAGESDAVAPVAQHAMPFYNGIPSSTIKVYAEFAGGDHFVADSPVMNTTAALLGLSWLKSYVEGDTRYRQFIKTHAGLSSFLPQ